MRSAKALTRQRTKCARVMTISHALPEDSRDRTGIGGQWPCDNADGAVLMLTHHTPSGAFHILIAGTSR
jgi:hypothetical protein